MSEPEISRRCSSCGASVRPHSLFCPQCGHGMVTPTSTPEDASSDKQSAHEMVADEAATQTFETVAVESARTDPSTTPLKEPAAEKPSMSGRDAIHRATDAARAGFEDNVRRPVKKLRKVSGVVIDQAAYDPSLRFLLVAGIMFLLFLVLLILSKLVG